MSETLTFDVATPAGTVFGVDRETRTIRGMAMPYGVVGTKAGRKFQFSKGTIHPRDGMKVKGWGLHDQIHAFGVVTEWDDTDDGLIVAIKAAPTPEGDRALANADTENGGPWDGMSIGPSEGAKYVLRDGVYHSVDIPIHEISLTPAPVFSGARVSSVAFDVIDEGNKMTATATETVEAPPAVDFSALGETLTGAIEAGFAGLQFPQRETVSATGATEINEPSPYRFDGIEGAHGFVDDMRAAQFGDGEARQRLEVFGAEAFAVTTSNVSTLNVAQNRPDLYVPNLSYSRPLWESVSNGSITDKTPFTVPKFASAAGLVSAHTEGVEPTPGSFTATSQTVTPGAMSGKIEILREVIDAGGTPQVDAIVWAEMVNGYYEAVEAKIAAALQAVPTAELNFAGAADTALVDAMTNFYAGLQFVRGGNRYTGLVLDGSLFPALVNAKDSTGRKLLPVLGPTNAQGTVSGAFDRVSIGNQTGRAAWALGTGNAARSFAFVPTSVWAWASAPKRFTFEYQVKSVDLAVWGYSAAAVLRDSDVKPLDLTTADS